MSEQMNTLQQKAYIFGKIFTISNWLQTLGDKFDKNITTKQWLFILGVSHFQEPPILSEVANLIGYSRQNAKRIAADLQSRGYVIISRDQKDARALRIRLTPSCIEYFKKRDQREIDFLEKLFAGIEADLVNSVCQVLIKLEQNIKTMNPG